MSDFEMLFDDYGEKSRKHQEALQAEERAEFEAKQKSVNALKDIILPALLEIESLSKQKGHYAMIEDRSDTELANPGVTFFFRPANPIFRPINPSLPKETISPSSLAFVYSRGGEIKVQTEMNSHLGSRGSLNLTDLHWNPLYPDPWAVRAIVKAFVTKALDLNLER